MPAATRPILVVDDDPKIVALVRAYLERERYPVVFAFASLSWPISVPRYILGVFPIFLAMGAGLTRPIGPALLVASVLLLGMCVTLFAIGHWAF